MRIRNKKSYTLGLSYAGKVKGYSLRPGGLSPELPPDRFYHPQLQKDLKRGYIEVLMSETDKEMLGTSVATYAKEKPTSTVRTSPTAQTVKKVLQQRAEDKQEKIDKVTEEDKQKAIEKLGGFVENEETLEDVIEPIPEIPEEDLAELICARPSCNTPYKNLQEDDRVAAVLCQYCRQQVTRRRNKLMKDDPGALVSDLYNIICEDMGLEHPTEKVSDVEEPTIAPATLEESGEDNSPDDFGYGVSLADLNTEG